jgi:predicted thioesterase
MKNPFRPGDEMRYTKRVLSSETARFESGEVHPFYGTFALARDAEWAGRLFVLEMKDEDEEGIGTFVNVKHLSPAIAGDEVQIISSLEEVQGSKVNCRFEAFVGERKIAEGSTGQMILKKTKLKEITEELNG